MADPDRISELDAGAGFAEPEIEQVEVSWPYGDAEDHWQLTLKLAGPLADKISEPGRGRGAVRRGAVAEEIEPSSMAGGNAGRDHVVTTS